MHIANRIHNPLLFSRPGCINVLGNVETSTFVNPHEYLGLALNQAHNWEASRPRVGHLITSSIFTKKGLALYARVEHFLFPYPRAL